MTSGRCKTYFRYWNNNSWKKMHSIEMNSPCKCQVENEKYQTTLRWRNLFLFHQLHYLLNLKKRKQKMAISIKKKKKKKESGEGNLYSLLAIHLWFLIIKKGFLPAIFLFWKMVYFDQPRKFFYIYVIFLKLEADWLNQLQTCYIPKIFLLIKTILKKEIFHLPF